MNLNEIIGTLNELKDIIEMTCPMSDHVIKAIAEKADKAIQDLTIRSIDQKPKNGQWCLLLKKDMPCLVAQYNMCLDSFVGELSIYKSESFKWLPAPEWKGDE